MKRRTLLKGALALTAGSGLLGPIPSLALPETMEVFTATSEAQVLKTLFGEARPIPDGAVRIEAPIQAMQGKPVPVKVSCVLDHVSMIAIVTANNRYPLNTYVKLIKAGGYYSTRIRMEQSSMVTAYVMANGDLFSAAMHIKVNRGGYGMHYE